MEEDLAERAFTHGDAEAARMHLANALKSVEGANDRIRLLRRARDASLNAGQLADADEYQTRLLASVTRTHRSSVILEYGQALLVRAEYRHALSTLVPLTTVTELDVSARSQLWQAIARAASASGDRALAKRAVQAALRTDPTSANSAELKRTAEEIYGREGGLGSLIDELEHLPLVSHARLEWVADLNEDLGRLDRALAYRRRLTQLRPRDLDTHLALLRTLEVAGQTENALSERELIVQRFPESVEQAVILASELQRRGQQERAVSTLTRLEARTELRPDALYRIADAWEHLGQRARAQRLLQRLPKTSTPTVRTVSDGTGNESPLAQPVPSPWRDDLNDAEHLIQEGRLSEAIVRLDHIRQAQAVPAWILARVAALFERAAASATSEATALREQAESLWLRALESDALPPNEEPSAIEHLVRLWAMRGVLAEKVSQLEQRFVQASAKRRNGLWLAEAQVRLGHPGLAEQTLERLLNHLPADAVIGDKLLSIWLTQANYLPAIELLEQRLEQHLPLDVSGFPRLIELSTLARREDLALRFVKRWLAVSPSDPEAWLVYGRILRSQPDDAARSASDYLVHAFELDERRFDVLLELSDWESLDGDTDSAFAHLLFVLRQDEQEPHLAAAARSALALATTTERLEQLELALRRAEIRAPASSEVRDVLVEVYATLLDRAWHDSTTPDQTNRERARERLSRIGRRASATLVAALSDRNEARQGLALDLLKKLALGEHTRALLAFAVGTAKPEFRSGALMLAGTAGDPAFLSTLREILELRDYGASSNPLAKAAAYGISRIPGVEATRALRTLVQQGSPELRGLVALWLAERGERSSAEVLRALLGTSGISPMATLAARLALWHLGERDDLNDWSSAPGDPSQAALVALVISADASNDLGLTGLARHLAQVPFDTWDAAATIASRSVGSACAEWNQVLARSDEVPSLERTLAELIQCSPTVEQRLELFSRVADALGHALAQRIARDPEDARQLGQLMLTRDAELTLGLLTPSITSLSESNRRRLSVALEQCLRPLAPVYEQLLGHGDPKLRRLALEFLARSTQGKAAEDTISVGLRDPDREVRLRAIRLARLHPSEAIALRIGSLLQSERSFVLRQAAADALGRLTEVPLRPELLEPLRHAARHDPFTAVRMAALSSFVRKNPLAANAELSYVEEHDSEPEVVRLARRLRENRR